MTSLRLTLASSSSSPKLLAPSTCALAVGFSSRRPKPSFPTSWSVFEGHRCLPRLTTGSRCASTSPFRCFASGTGFGISFLPFIFWIVVCSCDCWFYVFALHGNWELGLGLGMGNWGGLFSRRDNEEEICIRDCAKKKKRKKIVKWHGDVWLVGISCRS